MERQENKSAVPQEERSLSEACCRSEGKSFPKCRRAGMDPFAVTTFDVTAHAQEVIDQFETMEGQNVRLAGRIMSWRDMGKAAFMDLSGYVRKDPAFMSELTRWGRNLYRRQKKYLDIGDIVGVSGRGLPYKARGNFDPCQHVPDPSKGVAALPEKFHGLKDTDLRYRQRYLDLIVNPEVRDTFVTRSKVISAIRRYLDGLGFFRGGNARSPYDCRRALARPFYASQCAGHRTVPAHCLGAAFKAPDCRRL